MAENKNKKPTKAEKEVEDWMARKWRPMMAMMYMSVCFFDFIIAPIGWTIVQFWETQAANDAFRQWQPLTLSGAGLFHMAMGAVLGITAWSRGQEKMAGVTGTPTPPTSGLGSPTPTPVPVMPPPMPMATPAADSGIPAIKPIIKKPDLNG